LSRRYFGYVTSRPFGSFVMPVPAQNSCLRDYVSRNGGVYVPPQLEHKFESCFMQLAGTTVKAGEGDFILMYSVEMILESPEKSIKIMKRSFERGTIFAFVLENIMFVDCISFLDFIEIRKIGRYIMPDKLLFSVVGDWSPDDTCI